jgi:hypothetical protein
MSAHRAQVRALTTGAPSLEGPGETGQVGHTCPVERLEDGGYIGKR